jgi:hypothetical protein
MGVKAISVLLTHTLTKSHLFALRKGNVGPTFALLLPRLTPLNEISDSTPPTVLALRGWSRANLHTPPGSADMYAQLLIFFLAYF